MKSRKCIICGDEFVPTNPRQKVCKKDHYHPCPICGKLVLANSINEQNKCCSRKCGQQLGNVARKKTFQEKYGVDNPRKLQTFHRICKYCGKEFETCELHQMYCGQDYYKCLICGKAVKIADMSQVGNACSEECRFWK